MTKKIQIGDIARDTVSGYEGVVVGRTTYLYNVDRLSIQPSALREGKLQDQRSFDEPGMEYVGESAIVPVSPMTDDFKVGDTVRHKITGLEGVIIGRSRWISGCHTISMQPKGLNKDGEPFDLKGFEEHDVELVQRAAVKEKAPARKTGGPKPEPRRFSK